MCGIFGYSHNNDLDLQAARASLNTLSHRGPDQWGDWRDENLYLGHRRLSILDLSQNARQPMQSDHHVLTANGEIWNHQDLHAQLAQNFTFHSQSDSEILLHGAKQWGINGLINKIQGMFAFALYDKPNKILTLARDRYGVKPLYFAQTSKGFAFASEIKALFEWDDTLRYFSKTGIKDWLLYRGGRSGFTPYAGIYRLLPGYTLRYDIHKRSYCLSRYYNLADQITSRASNPDEIEDHLQGAVHKRLMGDVPIGVQLSGGVDSSLVSSLMRKSLPNQEIHSFSIGFADEKDKHFSEEPYAQRVANDLNLTHHQYNITSRDVADHFTHAIWLHDGMLDFPNSIPIYLLSKYAKNHITAQLTGEGADELLAGYTKFKYMQKLAGPWYKILNIVPWSAAQNLPAKYARAFYLARHYGGDQDKILRHINSYISHQTLDHIFGPGEQEDISSIPQDISFLQKLVINDHQTYLQAVLERQDKASMGAGVESRVPFLDQDFVHYAINLPASALIEKNETKAVLKTLAATKFDKAFAYRKKRGFPMPVKQWMSQEQGLKRYADKIYDDDFLLREYLSRYQQRSFGNVLLHYADTEHQWMQYFFMVLRAAQDVFHIRGVKP